MNVLFSQHLPNLTKISVGLMKCIQHFACRLRRCFFSRTSFRVYLIGATLICLTYLSLRWYGRHALEAEKERVSAFGLATDWNQLTKPMPAEEENFLAAPPFAEVFATPYPVAPKVALWLANRQITTLSPNGRIRYTTARTPSDNTLAAWCEYFRKIGALPSPPVNESPAAELLADEKMRAIIKSILEAAQRPYSRFPIPPAHGPYEIYERMRPEVMNSMMRCLQLYARAQLETGHPEEAIPVFRVTHHVASAFASEPSVLTHIYTGSTVRLQKTLLRAGIVAHAWPADFLRSYLEDNYPALLQKSGRRAFEGDRLIMSGRFEHYRSTLLPLRNAPLSQVILWEYLAPDYYYINAAVRCSQYYAGIHAAAEPLEPQESWASRTPGFPAMRPTYGPVGTFYLEYDPKDFLLGSHVYPIIQATLQHLAAALELHYLTRGRYPMALDELNPASSVPFLPLKDIDGQTIRYITDAFGSHFTLISVGADGLLDSPPNGSDDIVFSTDPQRKAN